MTSLSDHIQWSIDNGVPIKTKKDFVETIIVYNAVWQPEQPTYFTFEEYLQCYRAALVPKHKDLTLEDHRKLYNILRKIYNKQDKIIS